MNPDKKAYSEPELRILGTVEAITKMNLTGEALDADFAAGTPFGDLTGS